MRTLVAVLAIFSFIGASTAPALAATTGKGIHKHQGKKKGHHAAHAKHASAALKTHG